MAEELSGQENILGGAEKAALIVKGVSIMEKGHLWPWDNSKGIWEAKPHPAELPW